MLFCLYSPSGAYDATFLANYTFINIYDRLSRVPGIGIVQVFGAGQYAMRCWVNPDQLAKLQITVPEIIAAVNSQNTVNPAGQVGGEPVPPGQEFTYTVNAQGRLTTPQQFGNIMAAMPTVRLSGSRTWPALNWAPSCTTSGAVLIPSDVPAAAPCKLSI